MTNALLIQVAFGFNVTSFNLCLIENKINVLVNIYAPTPARKFRYRVAVHWQRSKFETDGNAKGLMTRVKVFGLSMKGN